MKTKKSKTRNLIGIILIILIGLVIWSMISTQAKWKYSNLGLSEYKKGNYQQAINNYTKAIEAYPDVAFLYNNRGLAYSKLKEYEKSISDYNKAIELKPDYAEAYFNKGQAHLNKGPLGWGNPKMIQKGIADLDKAIELNPKYADAYYHRGLGYNQSVHYYFKPFSENAIDMFKKAVADFNKVLELDPDYVLVYAGLGNAYYRYGEWDKATEYYNKALESENLILKKVGEKGLEEVYHSRGRNYAQFQRTHPDASSDYEKLLEINPESLDALGHLALLFVTAREYKEALVFCNKGINLIEAGKEYPEASLFYSYRAQCYSELGEYDKAIADFEKTMSFTKSGGTYRHLGFCFLKMGKTKKAKQTFGKGIAFINEEIAKGGAWAAYGIPSLFASYLERGLCYQGLEEYDKAISDFEKTRESNPPYLVYGKNYYVEATKNLGIVYMKLGDDKQAKSYLMEALKRAELPEVGASETAREIRELLSQ